MNNKKHNSPLEKSSKQISLYFPALFIAMLLEQICAFCPRVIFLANYLSALSAVAIILIISLVLTRLLTQRRTVRELLVIIFLLTTSVLSYLISGSMILFYLVSLPLIAEKTSFKKVIKADLIIKIGITIFILICYKNNLTTEFLYYRNGEIRESLGFTHPNKLGYMALMLFLDSYYLLPRKNKNIIVRLLIAAIPIILCILADSRTALYAILAIAIVSILDSTTSIFSAKRNKPQSKLPQKLIRLIPAILIIASMFFSMLYGHGSKISYELNDKLSGRISLQNYYDENYSYSLLGTTIDSETLEVKPLDNGYYRVLYMNGLVGVIAILVITNKSFKKTQNNNKLTFYLIVLLIYALSEWMIFRLTITPFWMIAFEKNNYEE